MTPLPCVGQLVDDRVDLVLGADIDAARRLVEDQHLGLGEQPFAQHHLLLVAAREVDASSGRRWSSGCRSFVAVIVGDRESRACRRSRRASDTPSRLASVMLCLMSSLEDQAVGLAVLGDVGDARCRRPCSIVLTSICLPCMKHLAADVAAIGAAEHAHGELGAAGAHQARRCRRPRRARTCRLTSLMTSRSGVHAGGRRASPAPRTSSRRSRARAADSGRPSRGRPCRLMMRSSLIASARQSSVSTVRAVAQDGDRVGDLARSR